MAKHLKLLGDSGNGKGRLDFGHLVDKMFWAAITGILYYGVQQIGDLSKSVAELNQKMAVVVTQVQFHEKRLDFLDSEISRRSGAENR